ncbi:MAG: hypothetical protein J6039_01245 [Alphaproteobacteria bacterium]|nr:hypothetical protein [Alphaproteobacteria bacterium]
MKKYTGIFFMLLCACVSKPYSPYLYQEKLEKWVGKNREQLYAYWGYPQQQWNIDKNTSVVSYYQTEQAPTDDDFEPYAGIISAEAMEEPQYGLPPAPPLFYCKTSFVIRDNRVISYNFNGDDCH